MSRRRLKYYFSLQSPWSYLGHADAMAVAARHDAEIVWKPIDLLALFPESGGLPLAKRHPKRQAYRDIELQRWRDRRDIPLKLRPAYWPVAIALADKTVVSLAEQGLDPDPFVRQAFAGLWAEDANLANEATLRAYLTATGADAGVLDDAKTPAIAATYEAHTAEALEDGVFGAPTFILSGEPFWGQDRLPLLDEALASGRAPYRA